MCLFLDTSGVWCLSSVGVFRRIMASAHLLGLCLVMSEEVYKLILGYMRYRQKKWLKNLAIQV